METEVKNQHIMRYWDLLKDLSDSDKFELGLMLMESVKSSFSAPKNDEDWWVKEMWKEPVKPYTIDEINARIDQSEREMAAGLGQDSEEMFREIEEEFLREEAEYELENEMAEAV
ncbi:MAG: hypothetical protein IKO99_00645 [Bacteroidales bacterium]|nr:hypothetical protein [Bacteroidales bacterium]